MYSLFEKIGTTAKVKSNVNFANHGVFRLHYMVTVAILIGCSLLVTFSEHFATLGPIQCIGNMRDRMIGGMVNQYCWISSTYTVPRHWDKLTATEGAAYPGVGPEEEGDDVEYHAYYQWVPIVLILQAMSFYLPYHIWKHLGGNLVNKLTSNLNLQILVDPQADNPHVERLSEYFATHVGYHRSWYFGFVFCEILCFFTTIFNIFFTNLFLGYNFLNYGPDVVSSMSQDPEERTDPMSRVFPRMTKCTFPIYGPSGTIQKFDHVCILYQNIINEKTYYFLWFWFIALALVTFFYLVLRNTVSMLITLRAKYLVDKGLSMKFDNAEIVVAYMSVSDWYLLYQISRFIDPVLYTKLIDSLAGKLNQFHGGKDIYSTDDSKAETLPLKVKLPTNT